MATIKASRLVGTLSQVSFLTTSTIMLVITIGGHRISSLFQICGVYRQEYHKIFGTSIHYLQSFSGEFFVKFIPGPFLNVKNDTRLLAGIVNKSGAEILCIMILQKRGNQGR